MSNTITAATDAPISDELAVIEDTTTAAVAAIKSGQALAYNSIQGDDFDTRLTILQAITDSEPISQNLGKAIPVRNIVIQVIDLTDPLTGELTKQPRILLITEDGTAYHAISSGLLRSLNNLIGVMGHPSEWPGPINVTVTSAKGKVGSYFTAKYGAATKK